MICSVLSRLRAELDANGTVDMEVVDDLIDKVMKDCPQENVNIIPTIGRGNMVEFRKVKEHIEVYKDGVFIVSADNLREAQEELDKMGIEY